MIVPFVCAFLGLALAVWMPNLIAEVTLAAISSHGGSLNAMPRAGDQAVVVLGGNLSRGPKAAAVAAASGLPLYIACCNLDQVVARSGGKAKWTESVSTNTETNASVAACTLLPLGIKRIALVTDDFHMARATLWFRLYGFTVTKVPSAAEGALRTSMAKRIHARHELGGLAEAVVERLIRLPHPLRCDEGQRPAPRARDVVPQFDRP